MQPDKLIECIAMALMYIFGMVSLVCIIGIIWARHELNKPEQAK